MSTIRGVKDRRFNFVQLLNSMFEDSGISLKAKGFIGYCLTKPSDWHFHISHLCNVLKEGEKAIYAVINECIEQGYAYRYQPRSETGEYLPWETIVSDSKHEISQIREELEKCLPDRHFGDADVGDAEKVPHSNTDVLPIKKETNNNDDDDARETADLAAIIEQEKSIPEKIAYRNPSGHEQFVSKNEIFRRFIRKPFKTDTLIIAIKRLIERKDMIGNVFKYLEAICSQIESNDHPIQKTERKSKKTIENSILMPKEGQEFAPGISWEEVEKKRKTQKEKQNEV